MARRGSLRASDEDRERIVERLHRAATEGRIAAEELEGRVSLALKARTYDELDSTVADLPAPRTRRHQPEQRSAGRRAVSTVAANPILLLFAIPVLAVSAAMLLAVTMVWLVLMVVVLVLGGRPRIAAPPWTHARRHLIGARGRGPGRYWA